MSEKFSSGTINPKQTNKNKNFAPFRVHNIKPYILRLQYKVLYSMVKRTSVSKQCMFNDISLFFSKKLNLVDMIQHDP